jgi:hypothetical protein
MKINRFAVKNGAWALLILVMFSCQETGQEDFNILSTDPDVVNSHLDKEEFENKLIEISTVLGVALRDKAAMNELFSFAELEGNDGDIGYSLKRLFEDQTTPFSKKKSAIHAAVSRNSENFRTNGTGSNIEGFKSFVTGNDIDIVAPYLARNFKPEEIDELTISWWTKEMEEEGFAKDPNWPGETPAFKIKLNREGDLLDEILNSIQNNQIEFFMVGDEYAMKNPTIVLGDFDEDLSNLGSETKSLTTENMSFSNVVPFNVGVNCNGILASDLVRYQMPAFRILDNTRSWPNGNFISIWVAYSAYNSSGGVPSLSFSVNQILNLKKLSRGAFSWRTDWVPPLLTHWDITNYSIQIIVAHEKSNILTKKTVQSVAINPTTGVSTNSSVEETWSNIRLYGTNTWYRCQEINGAHTIIVPPSNQLYNGNAVWQMQSPEGRCEFTLEPRLTRW